MFSHLVKRYHDLHDLQSWRDWLIDLLSTIYVFAFPFSMIFMLPTYIVKKYYSILAIDAFFWLLLVARSFFPRIGYRIRIIFWIGTLYSLTITFFVVFGPAYARPVWMVTCVAIVSVFVGTLPAVISVVINALFLMAAYFFLGPDNSDWQFVYRDGLLNWIVFVVNSSLLSMVVALPVGMLISRLNLSLEKERRGKQELQAAMEELEATNEEFEAQNRELIHSQEELTSKELFIRRIMENAPAAVFRISLDSLVVEYANQQALQLTGYLLHASSPASGLIEKMVPDEWRQKIQKFWADFLLGKETSFIRFPIIQRNGMQKWVELRLVLVKDMNGRPAAVEGFGIDITAQVEAGEALKASEEQYRSLIESITEAVFSVDANGNFTYMSPGIRRFGDFNPSNLVGKNFLDFIHPDDREGMVRRFVELSDGIEVPYDYRIVSPSGDIRWVQSYSRGKHQDGVFIGASGIITDIHERRMAEDTLRQSQATLESFINALPDPAFLIDEDRSLLAVNTALAVNLGRERSEILGKKAADLFSSGLLERSFHHIEKCFANGTSAIFSENIRERDYVIYIHPVLNDTGRVTRIAVFALDVTAQKSAEAEKERTRMHLIQAQKMEAVGTLAGGIAHDFNNMLGGIMGSINMIELLLAEEGGFQKEAVLKYVETAMESSRRAAEMTRQLLALSRKSELKLAPVDITLSIKHVVSLCRNTLPKSVEIKFYADTNPVRILADPVQMEQVLLNLFVNASHAMTIMRGENEKQGGILGIDAVEIWADGDLLSRHSTAVRGAAYARIRVSDTGVGMNDEIRRNIFDPFFTTKETGDGTGLGLAMAYGIVQQHGGFIDVYSEPGRGSTFTVYLPVYQGEADGSVKPPAREGILPGKGRILVVDDEESLLKISRGILEMCGYSVVTANNGKEGIEKFRAESGDIDCVLLDFSLVGLSGIDVFNALRQIRPSVRVILTSGLMDEGILQKAFVQGLSGFIQKPYSARELSMKMKEVMD